MIDLELFTVRKLRTNYEVSTVGEDFSIKIRKELVDKIISKGEGKGARKKIAILLAIIEFKRRESESKRSLIKDDDFLDEIKALLKKGINLDELLTLFSEKKYHEIEESYKRGFEDDLKVSDEDDESEDY